MLKYIIDAILVCVLFIWMTNVIATFNDCIRTAATVNEQHIEQMFKEAGL